jgi:hypothetical protein
MTKTIALLVSAIVLFAVGQATAGLIYGTGQGGSPGGRDSNWRIVAAPGSFTPPSSQTTPYDSYILSSVPWVFIGGSPAPWSGGGPQTGVTFNGTTNYWIAPTSSSASIAGGNYNWIVAQDFNVEQAGLYDFNFNGAGDNELDFYINGSITSYLGDPQRPTITGGTQIGNRAGNFLQIWNFTGSAYMNAGTNTAYMVLWDYGGDTGALIQQSTFAPSAAVPETGQVVASLLLLAGIGGYVAVKRRRAGKPAKATC